MPIGRMGQDFIVNTTTGGDQNGSAVTALPDGRILVVWGSGDSGNLIRGRVLNADGSPDLTANAGDDFIVNSTIDGYQDRPAITPMTDGRFIVTWPSSDDGDGSGSCIRARVYNADGSPDVAVNGGSDFVVNTTSENNQDAPHVTTLADGRLLYTWHSFDPGTQSDIRGRIFNADGSPDTSVNGGNDFVINTTVVSDQWDVTADGLSDGRFVVTWFSRDTGDGSGGCIRARVYSADGTPDLAVNGGNDFIVNTKTEFDQHAPVVTALEGGRFVVVWHSDDSDEGTSLNIRARVFGADGNPDPAINGGDDFVVNTTTVDSQLESTVTALADGRFVVSWRSDDPADGSSSCIRARLFNLDGTPGGDDFIVNTTADDFQAHPSVAALADGRFVVSWTTYENGLGDIRATIFDPTIFNGTTGDDVWKGGNFADRLVGGAGNDTFFGFGGDDRISGDSANDTLDGGAGNDQLFGGTGDDVLTGGTGNDELFGGDGADLFVFNSGAGDDEIGDFVVNTDHLMLNGITIASTSEVDGNSDGFMDTLVTFSSGDTVLLSGVTGVTDPGDLIA
jgi:Ca2+-binding RTX toxin-like protein